MKVGAVVNAGTAFRLLARVFLDIVWLNAGFVVCAWITLPSGMLWRIHAGTHAIYAIVFTLIWCAITLDQHLYDSRRGESLTAILLSVMRVYIFTVVLSGFGLALLLRGAYDRSFFIIFTISALTMVLTRMLVFRPGMLVLRRHFSECRVLFIGADRHAADLAQAFLVDEHRTHHIVGFLEDDPARAGELQVLGLRQLGAFRDIERTLIERMVDEVYVSLPLGSHYEEVERLVHVCEAVGVPVRLMGNMLPVPLGTCDVSQIGDTPILSLMSRPGFLTRIQLRRLVEIVAAALLLILLAPLFVLLAVLVLIDSRGPVFIRVSQDGAEGARWAFRVHPLAVPMCDASDARPLTRVGRLLRQHGFENLPQLVHVVSGKLSFAGVPLISRAPADAANSSTDSATGCRIRAFVPTFVLAALDASCIGAAYVLAVHMTSLSPSLVRLELENYLPFGAVLLLAWYSAAIEHRLWRWRSIEPWGLALFSLIRALGYAAVISGFLLAVVIPGVQSTRQFLVTFFALAFVLLVIFRGSARFGARLCYMFGYRILRIAFVGGNERTAGLIEAIGSESHSGYHVAGLLENDKARVDDARCANVPYLGRLDQLDPLLRDRRIDEVFVTLPVRSHYDTIRQVLEICGKHGRPVHVAGNVLPVSIAKIRAVVIGDVPLISLSTKSEAYAWLAAKRLTDFLVATVLLVTLMPLFLVLAVCIKVDSRGPVFFAQDRVGQNHRRFKMIKFRSMVSNAEALKQGLMHLNEADGPVFKIKDDPRITPLGHFLRKYSLDELPQLFNVWLGHMSLVGPRPLMPHEVDRFEWYERRRLSVKPGMTGSWQVSGRSDIPFAEWIQMDLAYIDSWSFSRDVQILLKTFKAVISGRGAA